MHINEDGASSTLIKRYFVKFFANGVNLLFNLALNMVVPRSLGPALYGDFNFLTNFFMQIISFFDMGTSTCYYTKLSQRPEDKGLVTFYNILTNVIFVLIILLVAVAHLTGLYKSIWIGQRLLFIYLSAFWAMLTWAINVLTKTTDALALTVESESNRILQRIISLVVIIILFYLGCINIVSLFFYHYVIMLILIFLYIRMVNNKGFSYNIKTIWFPKINIRSYYAEFYKYSSPLIIYAFTALIVGVFDRWLLQLYGGSINQGFFGLSYQIGAICFLFVGAMTPLLTREFTIAYQDNNITGMAYLFRRYIPLLYSIAAYFSCFVAAQADKAVYIFGGNGFDGAVQATVIMAFYPIHQTYGQLSGSLFYATGQTRLYRNIGIFFMTLGLPLTYFLLAPKNLYGMSLGASGLAIKMVVMQILAVNVQLFYNSQFLKLTFYKYVGHQFVTIVFFVFCSLFAKHLVSTAHLFMQNELAELIISGIVYTCISFLAVCYYPALAGLNRADINGMVSILIKRKRRKLR